MEEEEENGWNERKDTESVESYFFQSFLRHSYSTSTQMVSRSVDVAAKVICGTSGRNSVYILSLSLQFSPGYHGMCIGCHHRDCSGISSDLHSCHFFTNSLIFFFIWQYLLPSIETYFIIKIQNWNSFFNQKNLTLRFSTKESEHWSFVIARNSFIWAANIKSNLKCNE